MNDCNIRSMYSTRSSMAASSIPSPTQSTSKLARILCPNCLAISEVTSTDVLPRSFASINCTDLSLGNHSSVKAKLSTRASIGSVWPARCETSRSMKRSPDRFATASSNELPGK
ncbi:Uncharacterised protein [Mycobacterium tuberculosis]|nr:Uncharacterised protein [Mycobacterium tuberculosis]